MNVAINAIGFMPGQMGGIETYLRNLWHHLQAGSGATRGTLLCDEWNLREFSVENSNFSLKTCNYRKRTLRRLARSVLKKSIGYDLLRAEPSYLKYDLIHHPFTFIGPKWRRSTSVLTFADMQHEFYPQFFSEREMQFRNANFRPSVEAATRVIVHSEFTKNCLVERYGADPEKVDIVYHGCGRQYRVVGDPGLLEAVRRKYDLQRPFLYYPAATWPHKNHIALLDAVKLLVDRRGFAGGLVLTGIAMQSHDKILQHVERLGLSHLVKVLGYLEQDELPFIYNLARLLVFPSLFEGFGIPLVEAMACGCPVLCSNSTSLPEVAGEAGVMFDPSSPEDIAGKIDQLWYDDARLGEMSRAGIERAPIFRWEAAVCDTLAVYEKTVIMA